MIRYRSRHQWEAEIKNSNHSESICCLTASLILADMINLMRQESQSSQSLHKA